ncbi:tyrosine-type recombinase/integrase [Gemmatimonadota bacterium]
MKRAKIDKGHFHALRDTAATWMLHEGVSIYVVSRILGHSSVVVTEKYYGHLAESDLKAALDTIPNAQSGTDLARKEKAGNSNQL